MERLAGRIILLWGWRRALAAFAAGALAVLTQAPFDFFAAGFVSFPILVWLLDGATVQGPASLRKRLAPAFSIGWWFGFGYFLAGLWWIGNALLVEADSFAWALPMAVIGIPAGLAFFYAFATALAWLMWTNNLSRIVSLAFAFGLAEWLRTFLFTGFPWNPIGFAAMPTPLLMQSVVITGMVGMNALAVLVMSMPALLAARRNLRLGLAAAFALVSTHIAFGMIRLNTIETLSGNPLHVRIVQPDIDLSEKWDDSVRDRVFATTMELSAREPDAGQDVPDLILWPETSVPFLFTERPDGLAAIGDMLEPGQMLLAGAVREEAGSGNQGSRYYNSVVAINDRGEIVDAVDKVHLVPFGEYLPFSGLLAYIGIEQLVAGPMNFVAGSERHGLEIPGEIMALPFICYEIIFPDLVAADATLPTVIVNVTNDAWFGETPGPYQHFRQAQVRSVENGMPLLRAANTGISGVIDPQGRILDGLALNARGILDIELTVSRPVRNPILHPGRIGFAILLLFGAIAAIARIWHGTRAI